MTQHTLTNGTSTHTDYNFSIEERLLVNFIATEEWYHNGGGMRRGVDPRCSCRGEA